VNTKRCLMISVAFCVLGTHLAALAQGPPPPPAPMASSNSMGTIRAGFKTVLDVGGEADFDGLGNIPDEDLEPTLGFAFFGTYQLLQYVHVGMLIGFGWLQTDWMEDHNIDRNFYMDISPMIMGAYPLLGGDLEIFAMLPIGLTISVFSDELEDEYNINVETGVGWNVALMFGASYRVWEALRVMLEMGWQGRGAEHDIDNAFGIDFDVSTHQFGIRLGAIWEF
jgi:hypothetical protein